MSNKKDRGALFMRGLLAFVITILFLGVGAGAIALVVWAALEFGAVVLPAIILIGFVVALAWGVAGWLME